MLEVMMSRHCASKLLIAAVCTLFPALVAAQDMPPEYQQVLTTLAKQGDYKANVLKVNIPRNDLSVTVAKVKTPTPFGFGGWVAMTKGAGGMDVLMGDLVLTQDEVNPVMSALSRSRRYTIISSGKSRASSTCTFTGTDRPGSLRPN